MHTKQFFVVEETQKKDSNKMTHLQQKCKDIEYFILLPTQTISTHLGNKIYNIYENS